MDKYFLGAHRNSEASEWATQCGCMTNRPEFPSMGSLSHKLSLIIGKRKLSSGNFAHTISDKNTFFIFVLFDQVMLLLRYFYYLIKNEKLNWTIDILNQCKDQ